MRDGIFSIAKPFPLPGVLTRMRFPVVCLLSIAAGLFAQPPTNPVVNPRGVINAYTQQPAPSPVPPGGIIRDREVRRAVLLRVVADLAEAGISTHQVVRSPITIRGIRCSTAVPLHMAQGLSVLARINSCQSRRRPALSHLAARACSAPPSSQRPGHGATSGVAVSQ